MAKTVLRVADPKLLREFKEFHLDNPHVILELEALISDRFARGQYKTGIGAAFEVLRWQKELTTSGDQFKLNNDLRSFYARLLLRRNPKWEGRIEVRGGWDLPAGI